MNLDRVFFGEVGIAAILAEGSCTDSALEQIATTALREFPYLNRSDLKTVRWHRGTIIETFGVRFKPPKGIAPDGFAIL